MTSCPSLLDTLGFLKFPDNRVINFSEDGTSDILYSLKKPDLYKGKGLIPKNMITKLKPGKKSKI